jgi:elongation of very long chain fatty acids protein 4
MWALWDDFCSRGVFGALSYLGFDAAPATATKDLLFVSSPTPLVTCVLAYLAIVGAGLLFDSKTKRDTPGIRAFVQWHNIFLIGLSGCMSTTAVVEAVRNGFWLWGNDYDPAQTALATIVYVFFLSKIYEFVDTFIMLAKGNVRQVSFLHVYHHVTVTMLMWLITYAAPGGDAYYSVVLNSLVHVVMYTYYLLANVVGADPVARKKYLWWSPYLTRFQMAQFVSMMLHSCYLLATGTYVAFIAKVQLGYMVTLFALFANFYLRKHCARKVRVD